MINDHNLEKEHQYPHIWFILDAYSKKFIKL